MVKKVIATVILFSSVPFGLVGMCWGRVLYSLIATYLNTYYTKSLIGLSLGKQVRDIAPYWLLAFAMGGVVVGASSLCDLLWLQLGCGDCCGNCFLFREYLCAEIVCIQGITGFDQMMLWKIRKV